MNFFTNKNEQALFACSKNFVEFFYSLALLRRNFAKASTQGRVKLKLSPDLVEQWIKSQMMSSFILLSLQIKKRALLFARFRRILVI